MHRKLETELGPVVRNALADAEVVEVDINPDGQIWVDRHGVDLAMIGVMGRREADKFFRNNANGLLFRGHSHQPEMISVEEKEIRFSPLIPGQMVELSGHRPCIVTCGALASGSVILWKPGNDRLECHAFG